MADYVITESGFGADMGMQKFMDIVCRQGGIRPSAVVLVATVKALQLHGGSPDGTASSREESLTQLRARHREPGRAHPHRARASACRASSPSTASRTTPTRRSSSCARSRSRPARSTPQHNTAVVDGGEGAADLARAVVKAAERAERRSRSPTRTSAPIEDKIAAIATKVYGADGVEFLPEAQAKLKRFTELGYGDLPICMAKTHLSISHDPGAAGRADAASRCRSATCAPTPAPAS